MDATSCSVDVLYQAAYKFLPRDSLTSDPDVDFEKLKGGMNNRVFLVHAKDQDYVSAFTE